MDGKAFSFCVSNDIDLPFRFKIGYLEGDKPKPRYSEYVETPDKRIQLYGPNSSDLMITAQLFADSKPLTIPVPTLHRPIRSNKRWNEWIEFPIKFSELPFNTQIAITVWEFAGPKQQHKVPYGGTTVQLFDKTDCTLKRGRQKLRMWLDKEADGLSSSSTDSAVVNMEEMDRLEKLIKKHEAGDLVQVDWLGNLAFRQIERINKTQQATTKSQHILYVDFIQFDFPIVYSDFAYPLMSTIVSQNQQLPMPVNTLSDTTNGQKPRKVVVVHDLEQNRENPIESKYRRLVRSHKSGPLDKELKPNAKIRDELNMIMNFSPVQELTDDEKNLLWKFRYYLARHKSALTKFLKAVTWEDPVEAKQVAELLLKWAEIDVADALELLGPRFRDQTVRSYAVARLKNANDDELELYLMQLVEALKFEQHANASMSESKLAQFLVNRALQNPRLGNYFYWYLTVESQEKGATAAIFKSLLAQFLGRLKDFSNGNERTNTLKAQFTFINKLLKISSSIKLSKESRPKKVEQLRHYLADNKHGMLSFAPIPLPLDPSVTVVGCVPEECNVFKSSLSPLKVMLKTAEGGTYPIIFKTGDDLRQDQLVVQIISLMDQLLRNENLDLRLTPYRILATGPKDGALQFIPNQTLAHVLTEYHGILPYLRQHNPSSDPTNQLGVKNDVMDTFVRSCAGYCVVTYILGVGDRHLDNLLICPDGHFFHADFGYILGRDPKPFPPMMKLPIQVIDGMGGAQSDNYDKFRSYCFTAFTSLRKNANLILNLFALMTESSIPDIMFEREKAVLKVKEKFCLEMTEAEAMVHFQNLINDSVNAFLPMVIDRLHNLAQYWRA
ncbi:phosphatidylinositol 3-kinase Vps34p [Trichomonascus vanleenenianus]|uniref:phosphatidylinositol 3-kinase VPS34 n=1 Tax=Trichomonascus vanleenenianus TaxID=2268995 RepID=UPI003ECA83E9